MPRLRLTKSAVEKLKAPDPSRKQKLHWDTELTGFGVLCSGKTSTKTYVVQRDLAGGGTRRVTVGPTNIGTLEEARAKAESILKVFYDGKDPKAGRRGAANSTLKEWLDAYLTARVGLTERSCKGYRATIERNLKPWLDKPMRDLTPEMVEKRLHDLKADVLARQRAPEVKRRRKRKTKTDIAPDNKVKVTGEATANSTMRALGVLWNFAADRVPDFPPNPVKRLRRQWYKIPRRERLLREDDLPKFYGAVQKLPNGVARDYLMFLLFTGLRRTEAASLTWDDVDFTGRLIRIPAARTKAGRKLDLPMTDVVHSLLVVRRSAKESENAFVFPADGKSKHITEPKFPLALVHKATGIHISAHDLRRTYITVAESTDISPYALKALVNHSLGNDVTSGYIGMTTERLRAPAQRVADGLKSLCGIAGAADANVVPLARV